jgi:hypothetical protein
MLFSASTHQDFIMSFNGECTRQAEICREIFFDYIDALHFKIGITI